jgi:2-iminobutanoate/2-iminopropanoate deaminase
MIRESIYPKDQEGAPGFYLPAVKIDLGNAEMIFVTGQQVEGNKNKEAVTDNIAEQTESVFKQIEKILEAAGSSMDDVVKVQIFLTDMNDFPIVSEIRKKYFAKCKPASTLLEVNAMTRKGAKVEIEVIAVKEKE